MQPTSYPTEDEIRRALLARVDAFTGLTGQSRTQIGLSAVNDSAIVGRIAAGKNFTVETYRRLMAWLDANWPAAAAEKAVAGVQS